MFLIPFIFKKIEDFTKFLIFLDKGNKFLEVEENEIDEFCEVNEIYFDKKNIKENYCYIQISQKTNLKNFYNYTEALDSNAECWRRFIVFDNDILHVNSTNPEFIQPILNNIIEGF